MNTIIKYILDIDERCSWKSSTILIIKAPTPIPHMCDISCPLFCRSRRIRRSAVCRRRARRPTGEEERWGVRRTVQRMETCLRHEHVSQKCRSDRRCCCQTLERLNEIYSLTLTLLLKGVCAINGLLYVIGGDDGSCNLSSVEFYNPAADKWSLIPTNMSNGRSYAGESERLRPRFATLSPAYSVILPPPAGVAVIDKPL